MHPDDICPNLPGYGTDDLLVVLVSKVHPYAIFLAMVLAISTKDLKSKYVYSTALKGHSTQDDETLLPGFFPLFGVLICFQEHGNTLHDFHPVLAVKLPEKVDKVLLCFRYLHGITPFHRHIKAHEP